MVTQRRGAAEGVVGSEGNNTDRAQPGPLDGRRDGDTVSPAILGIDLGKTLCRAALWSSRTRTDAEGAGTPGLAAPHGANLAEAAILAATSHLRTTGRIDITVAGVAGAFAAPAAAHELARRLCDALPSADVAVTSDAITSHAGALGGGPGVVLAAGTGAVAIGLMPDGEFRRVDGWGPWLGDEGGGAWIGLRGLRAALQAADGRGPATMLQAAAEAQFGPLAMLAVQMEGHGNPPRLAASFAPAIARAAEAQDVVATNLMRRAAEALATTARAAAGPGPTRLALTGGLPGLGRSLMDPLRHALEAGSPALTLVPAEGTALDGARLLATNADTVHERRVIRATAFR